VGIGEALTDRCRVVGELFVLLPKPLNSLLRGLVEGVKNVVELKDGRGGVLERGLVLCEVRELVLCERELVLCERELVLFEERGLVLCGERGLMICGEVVCWERELVLCGEFPVPFCRLLSGFGDRGVGVLEMRSLRSFSCLIRST
jgi:hypothetical protein